jgi:predicted GNAT family acetyltransferase
MQQQNSSAIFKTSERQDSADRLIRVIELNASHEEEALEFLSQRPIHTVSMVGFIHDNGIVSPRNRGTFFGCHNREGQLEGVALIGYSTLLETTTDRAAEALAAVAQTCTTAHMITGEKERINNFWHYYAQAGQGMKHACRELLFELKWPVEALPDLPPLRLATSPADLDMLAKISAELSVGERLNHSSNRDADGLRRKCARRIAQRRTWVCVEAGNIIFKADLNSYSSSVIFLKGVWTSADRRSQGNHLRCMSQLARTLLRRTKSICVLIDENDKKTHRFYQRAGYKLRAIYETIYLN